MKKEIRYVPGLNILLWERSSSCFAGLENENVKNEKWKQSLSLSFKYDKDTDCDPSIQ